MQEKQRQKIAKLVEVKNKTQCFGVKTFICCWFSLNTGKKKHWRLSYVGKIIHFFFIFGGLQPEAGSVMFHNHLRQQVCYNVGI